MEKNQDTAKTDEQQSQRQGCGKGAHTDYADMLWQFMIKQKEHEQLIDDMKRDFKEIQEKLQKEHAKYRQLQEEEQQRLASEQWVGNLSTPTNQQKAVVPVSGALKVYGPYGGTEGSDFSDCDTAISDIKQIFVWSGDIIDAIQVKYGDKWGLKHGGKGGGKRDIILSPGEYFTAVEVAHGFAGRTYGCVISSIRFHSNSRSFGWFGYIQKGCRKAYIDLNGENLAYISGRAGKFLYQLNFAVSE